MRRIVLNGIFTSIGLVSAGTSVDDDMDAMTIAQVISGGGRLLPATRRVEEVAAKVRAAKLRGRAEWALDAMMVAGFSDAALPPHPGLTWSPSGGGDVEDFDDVMAAVASSKSPFPIYTRAPSNSDPYLDVFADTRSYDLHGCWFENPDRASTAIVRANDKAVIRNLGKVHNSALFQGNSSLPCLEWDDPVGGGPKFCVAEFSAMYGNTGTAPLVFVPPGGFQVLIFKDVAGYHYFAGDTQGLVGLGAGAICVVGVLNPQMSNIDPHFVSGDATNGIAFLHNGYAYQDLPNAVGATQINDPFAADGGSGPTAFRPAGFFDPIQDMTFYGDTDLRKIVVWDANASIWRDALGNPV